MAASDNYGNLEAAAPKQGYLLSREETRWGDGVVMTSREDLIEAGDLGYDHDRAEWAFVVIGSTGCPRVPLGVFVIRLDDSGELMTTIE